MFAFNINQTIKCKLTNHGKLILEQHYKHGLIKGWVTAEEFKKIIAPKSDGFYHFQLHQFIKIFGDKIAIGSLPAVESCCIYFDEKDLETVNDVTHTDN